MLKMLEKELLLTGKETSRIYRWALAADGEGAIQRRLANNHRTRDFHGGRVV